MKRRALKLRRAFVVAAVLVPLAVVALFVFDNQLLRVVSPLQPADAIVVLGGEPVVRAQAAAPLLTNGLAPLVILSGQGDCEENRRLLKAFGVRTNVMELECDSTSTQENALFTVKLLREHQCQRVILVTSWFHSRRALSSFRKYAPEIEFLSMPAPRTQLWKYERGYIASEYVKMIIYGVRFGIFPWNT